MSYSGPPPGLRKYQAGSMGGSPGASSRSGSSLSWYVPKAQPHTAKARRPIAPPAISSRIRRSCGRSASPGEATSASPRSCASAIRSSASATVVASVLLTCTCLPASSASRAWAWCSPIGDAIETASTSPSASRLSMSSKARATPKRSATAAARPGTGSQTAVTRTRSRTSSCVRCGSRPRSAIAPVPTTPSRSGPVAHVPASSSSVISTARPSAAERWAAAITASTWIARSAESEGSPPRATVSTSCSTPSR